ncbi:ferritin-like domain-containing protein [Belnapia sp. T6]|uniref:Ferritin-like domain-containing protein n=1 Tax=Belnapia mucosa TaxID=2804532 RepID=A0ABS1UW61_9PROT|nr:ferritin-like domain-containing protein [Belnapia mucosa]MBL6453721.1 ferritin-like domain-containing protein [Belnapia mucosa]
MASTAQDIYITGLKNAHALEVQAMQLLERQVERIESYPEMVGRMKQHIEESRVQSQRLEQILERFGTSNSSLKDFGTGLMGNLAAMAHAPMQDEILKNTFANYAFEHFEIASYRGLIEMAQAAGDQQGIALLQQSLQEEVQMAEFIGQNLPQTVQKYIQLETSGQKSGI